MSFTYSQAQEILLEKSHKLSEWKQGERYEYQYSMKLESSPERIFPLLCPILEYEWLNNWKCTMVYSESGVAENDCIFYKSTGFPFYKRITFHTISYRPAEEIEFLLYIQKVGTIRMKLQLEPETNNITVMNCNYLLTGHSRFGNRQLRKYREKKIEKEVKSLEADLRYWLKNNSLRPL